MPSHRHQNSPILSTGIRYFQAYADARNQIEKWGRQTDTLVGDFLFMSTTDQEKAAITQACYETTGHLRGNGLQTLFDWEESWFSKDMPSPPARVLVAGAGWGREVVALNQLGYRVVAFEPAMRSDVQPNGSAIGETQIIQANYDDFVNSVIHGKETPLSHVCLTPFDAVLLGWGSLAHVFSPTMRSAVLEAAVRLVPDGPVLGSLWCRDAPEIANRNPWRTVATHCARTIAHLRGIESHESPDFVFSTAFGFAVYVTPDELNQTAENLGRELDLHRGPYAHFTLKSTSKLSHEA